jgi:hypothetical protein
MPKNRNAHKVAAPEGLDTTLSYRAQPMHDPKKKKVGMPMTMDEETRSVEMVGATEAAIPELDWDRWEMIPTILRMDGCQMPANGQLPLLDTHMRYNTACVIGSFRDCRVEGEQFIGRATFSSAAEAEGPYLKMKEGHLTDCSIARKDDQVTFIPDGQTGIVGGRSYTGPVKVVTRWTPKEMSICPIGADDMAKARAATPPVIPNRTEEKEMDPKIRAFLESRGLSKDATEEEAFRFLETLQVRTATPQVPAPGGQKSEDEIRAEAIRAEQGRIGDIRGICVRAGFTEAETQAYITGNTSVETVRQAAFDKVTAAPSETPGFRASLEMGVDARDKFRSAAEGALVLRCGLRHDPAQLAAGAADLRGYSLREMARECLRVAGQPTGGDPMQMVGRAFTTSDFPILLGNTANLSLLAGWDNAEETWEAWADGSGSVSDFKTYTLARAGETDDLDEIGEDNEYKYGTLAEASEQFKLATYGKLNKISRQAIINDDMGSISDAFQRRGEAAARKIGDLVYAVLTANSAMGDGVALFHASHANLGTTGALSATTAAEAIKLMGLQKDIGGKRRLNIPAKFFIGPKTKEGIAEIFFGSQLLDVTSGSQQSNPYAGTRFTRVYDARLDDASTTAFYFAGPKGKTIRVFFLNGNRVPYLEAKEGWNMDGVEFKTRIDAGAKALSWKGLVKNAGA